MNRDKNRAPLNQQEEDITLDGKFTRSFERQGESPEDAQYSLYKNNIYLPPIKNSNRGQENKIKTEDFIRQIILSQDKPIKLMKVQQTPKNRIQRSQTNTKAVRSDIVDLRKKQKKGCGSAKCKICNTDPNQKSNKTKKKRRVLSLPDYQENDQYQKIIVSRAFQTHKRQNKPKVKHIQELNSDGVFRLAPFKEKKPKKVQEYQEKNQFGRTFYQQMNINGKVYLVKKKTKRVSDINPSNARQRVDSQRINPKKNLYFSQVIPQNNIKQRKTPQYYRLNSQNRDYQNKYSIVLKEDDEEELARHQQQKRKRKMEEEYKKKQQQRLKRQQLNDQTRRYIHQLTYFQDEEKMNKMRQQNENPKKMRLNRFNTQQSDVEAVNIFSRNSSVDELRFIKLRNDEDEWEKRKKLSRNRDQMDDKYNIKFPQLNEINDAMKNYKPLTKKIDVYTLKNSPNFIREYSDQQGMQFFYFGQLDNVRKVKEGKGVLCTKNRVLEGVWKNNELVQGAELKQNGIYKGHFVGGKKHGEGSYEWINGEKYFGQWKQGKRHGRGQWTSRKGDVYVGDWKNGKATGEGQFITKDEGTYRGEFKDFIKHGYGKYQLPNGDIYMGDFWEGNPSGQGKYVWNNGLIYEGNFNDAAREGRGRLYKEGVFEIDGDFKNDLPHGICRCRLANGDIYTGKYSYGDRSGYGNYEDKDIRKSNVVPISYWSSDSIIRNNSHSHRPKW